jgi:folate-binding protein YgfZ
LIATPLLPHHHASGARLAEIGGRTVVLAFGDVPGEYRAAQESAALFDATDRGLLIARGPDAASFLHRMLSNVVRSLAPGQGNPSLLLSPKGKIARAFDLFAAEGELRMDTPAGQAAPLRADLDRYLFAEKLTLEDATAAAAPLELAGPRSKDVVERVLGPLGQLADHDWVTRPFQHGTARAAVLAVAGSPGWRVDAGPELARELWDALAAAGARPCGHAVRDILRVEAGEAAFGADVDENTYPQEARWESAFSLSKGCYVGQEVVAKIDTYGGLNKRLMALRVSDDEPVARGTRLMQLDAGEWRDLGLVTSWAYSFVLDAGLCLGYVKRRHQEPGTSFRLGDGPRSAVIVALPLRKNANAGTA